MTGSTFTDEATRRPPGPAANTAQPGPGLLLASEPTTIEVIAARITAVIIAITLVAASAAAIIIVDPFGPATGGPVASTASADAGENQLAQPAQTAQPAAQDHAASPIQSQTAYDQTPSDGYVDGTARYADLPTTRILDTRADDEDTGEPTGPLEPGGWLTIDTSGLLPATPVSNVVLSVNVAMAQGPGPITVAAGGSPVTAINVAKAGQMTTNLVVVPQDLQREIRVTSEGGGHVVIDLVGYFEPVDEATAGRFVPVATQRLAQLITEVDGREAVIQPLENAALPASGVEAVLVRISADVGGEGGMVRLGQEPDVLPNTMMWAPTSGDDRTRQGVAVVPLGELDQLAFSYNGGSVLDLDVLGYFTDGSALTSTAGLFVPASEPVTIEVEVQPGQPSIVDVADALDVSPGAIGSVFVNASAESDGYGELFIHNSNDQQPVSPTVEVAPGYRFGVTATTVDELGRIVVDVTGDLPTSVKLVIPGYFLP